MKDRRFSIAIAVASFVPRLHVALRFPKQAIWDGHYYDLYAKRLAEGFGYTEDVVVDGVRRAAPVSHYPVGYSAFLSIFYRVFGSDPRVAPIVNAVVGALLVFVVHRLAVRATTHGRARLAAVITAAHPGLILYTGVVMTEPLAAFTMFLAALAFVRSREASNARARSTWAALAGLVLGFGTLVRPTSIVCLPAFALLDERIRSGAARAWERWKPALAATAIAAVTTLAIVVPWTIRNCEEMDGCAFVSTNGGWNLAIGALPRATGRFETVRATDGCPIVTGQVQQDRCWLGEGLKWIAEDPKRWLSLAPKKLGYTFDHESFPVGYYAEAEGNEAWPEERRAKYRDVLSNAHRLLLAMAALGVVAFPVQRKNLATIVQASLFGAVVALALFGAIDDYHPFWPLALVIATVPWLPLPGAPPKHGVLSFSVYVVAVTALTHVVFFGEDRYHVPATPALCLLAACALRDRSESKTTSV